MDKEIKKDLLLVKNKGALVNGVPTSETFDNTTDSLEALKDAVGSEYDGSPDLYDTVVTGYDSSAIVANEDGSILERLEDLDLASESLDSGLLADYDNFDVADGDANTERWDIGYLNGAEGGSANISTTVTGKLMVKVDPDDTPTAAAYGVHLAQPIVSKYFTAIVDVNSTFGTPSGSWATTGMRISPTTYDVDNVVYLQRQNSAVGVLDRLAAGAIFATGNQGEVYFTTSDAAVAFKIERLDNVWRLYYSLTQHPNYVWVLLTQYEDTAEGMDSQQSVYLDSYSPGSADAETAQGDFDNFRLYLNLTGISQEIAGDYDSSAVAANEDGSALERLEQIQEAINRGTGSALPANKSLYDIIGIGYVDAGGGFGTDSIVSDFADVHTHVDDIDTDVGEPADAAAIPGAGTVNAKLTGIGTAIGVVAAGAGGGFEIDGDPSLYSAVTTIDTNQDKEPRVQEVIIYPVAEDASTTELADDGTSPAYYPAVATSTVVVGEGNMVSAWTEDIPFEAEGTITVISIYAEFEWQTRFLVNGSDGTNTVSKIQMSNNGGGAWVDITDNYTHNTAVMTTRVRAGVGRWVSTITAGANQLQFRLMHWMDVGSGVSASEAQIRSNSYVRVTYIKS